MPFPLRHTKAPCLRDQCEGNDSPAFIIRCFISNMPLFSRRSENRGFSAGVCKFILKTSKLRTEGFGVGSPTLHAFSRRVFISVITDAFSLSDNDCSHAGKIP